jgi:hypothetical protein
MAREVETMEYLAFVRRILKAAGKRVGYSDEYELRMLADAHEAIDEALTHAVVLQRAMGKSWADIGNALGISRQAAQQRFGMPAAWREQA